jgi:hypothetical protein
MKTVKFLRAGRFADARLGQRRPHFHVQEGEEKELNDETADYLIQAGAAVLVDTPEPEKDEGDDGGGDPEGSKSDGNPDKGKKPFPI